MIAGKIADGAARLGQQGLQVFRVCGPGVALGQHPGAAAERDDDLRAGEGPP